MSKVEAAASLFGSSDSGSDFFTAQEGGESRTDSPANGTDSNGAVINQDSSNLFENTADAGDATILFPGSDAQEDLFGESGQAKADIGAVAASAHGYEDYNAVNGSSSGNGLGNEASIETQYDYSQHGWDTQSGQWNGYGQYEPVQGAGTAGDYSQASRPTSTYDAWPSPGNTYQPNIQGHYTAGNLGTMTTSQLPEQSSYASASAHTQQSSDPYQSTYSPQQQTSAYSNAAEATSYDPYMPAAAETYQASQSSNWSSYSASRQDTVYPNASGSNGYDPYRPAPNDPRQSAPSSFVAAPSVASYDAYAPIQSSASSISGIPATLSSYPCATTFVPPPASQASKPASAPYRPASSNAYDPPIPVKKRSASAKYPISPYQGLSSSLSPPAPLKGLPPALGTSSRKEPPVPPLPPPPPRSSTSPAPRSSVRSRAASPDKAYLTNAYAHLQASPYDNSTNSLQSKPASSLPQTQYNAYSPPTFGGTNSGTRRLEQDAHPFAQTTAPHETTYFDQDRSSVNLSSELDSFATSGAYASVPARPTEVPATPAESQATSSYDPYKPNAAPERRAASPDNFQSFSVVEEASTGYAPPQTSYDPQQTRERAFSGSSSFSSSAGAAQGPYAPTSMYKAQISPPSSVDHHGFAGPTENNTFVAESQFATGRESLESYHSAPVTGPYAPSPSLLGTNDPLGRSSGKAPIINFGFGGKLITCFHARPDLNTGFDVALSARKRTDVHLRVLHKTIPESILDMPNPSYPGPLFGDPGSPVTAIMRTATSANTRVKAKKDKLLAYLAERAQELEKGIGYHALGSVDRRHAEGKLALVRLLRVLVENDGQLRGSPSVENAVRAALLPRMEQAEEISLPDALHIAPVSKDAHADTGLPPVNHSNHQPAMQKIQEYLLRGEKQKAYHHALDEKLFAHALVVASGIDKEAFKEAVNEFIRSDLGVQAGTHVNGLESLRLAYGLFSGQPSMTVQHLVPAKSLQASLSASVIPNHITPLTPNFPSPSCAVTVPEDVLSNWQEYAVMLFSGQIGTGTDAASALTNLGDCLSHNDWIEAAHCCYVLSPQSSPIGGVGAPNARVILVGSQSPQKNHIFFKDPDTFVFSEILEFALSLHAPAKGQDPFAGFAHLQAYRFIRALQLAELGYVASAKRYCEAIINTSHKPSPYLSQQFTEVLGELSRRLNGDPELDKANSWMTGKISKPSLDSIGDWLGGTLSKFVAGDGENSSPVKSEHAPNNPAYAGAFSHYSAISSANPSRGNSPVPSFGNHNYPPNGLPQRSGSAMALHSSGPYPPMNRSSSAMAYSQPESRKGTPPPPRLNSADATTTTFMQSQSFSQAIAKYENGNGSGDFSNGAANHSEEAPQENGWWGFAYGDSSGTTPTATSFVKLDEPYTASSSTGFISLMDDHDLTPSPSMSRPASHSNVVEDNEEDLGFGNSFGKKRRPIDIQGAESKSEQKVEVSKDQPKKPDPKPTTPSSSGSWLGRLFTRSASTTPGPVKANLGEESAFYYDKELKRWVNKNAAASTQPAAPPLPPPRAQTASPSRAMPPQGVRNSPPPPSPMPPGRPQSAMDSLAGPPRSVGPPKTVATKLRSSFAPDDMTPPVASAPPTPAALSGLTAAPPTGRPKSAAPKKNVRSRYVDVFQQ